MSTNWLAGNYEITLFQLSNMYLLHCAIFISALLEIMTRFSFSKYEEAILSEKSRTSWFHTPLPLKCFQKSYASVKKQKYKDAVVSCYANYIFCFQSII